MNKEQQELSEGVEMFDPQKVDRFGVFGGIGQHEMPAQYVAACDYDRLLTLFTAKDALIASLKESLQSTLDRESATTARYDAKIEALEAEILKQNKAEDELLATGEKLAEERK